MNFEYQRTKDEILMTLAVAPDQRLRPHDVERNLSHRLGVSTRTIHQAVKDLVGEGKVAYIYWDPCSYIQVVESDKSV